MFYFDNNTHILVSAGQVLKKERVEGPTPSRSTINIRGVLEMWEFRQGVNCRPMKIST